MGKTESLQKMMTTFDIFTNTVKENHLQIGEKNRPWNMILGRVKLIENYSKHWFIQSQTYIRNNKDRRILTSIYQRRMT